MITLKTLPEATAQEVFDQISTHLLTQYESCLEGETGKCKYHYNGLMCAAGCLISDEEYIPEMEGGEWTDLIEELGIPNNHSGLITKLQIIQDEYLPKQWSHKLNEIAHQENLQFNPPE